MYKHKGYSKIWLMALLLVVFMAGCADKNGITSGAATGPTVSSTNPVNSATGVAINQKITATFSEPMNAGAITPVTFTVTGPSAAPITGAVGYLGLTATFTPASNLAPNTVFTATITTGAQNPTGVPLAANYIWTFTTGLTADTIPPTVISTGVPDGATGLPIDRNSTATFSKPMDPVTINSPATTFAVKEFVSGISVPGVVSYIDTTATFKPNSNLKPNTKYTSTISTAAKDLAGNAMASAYVWSWTTGGGVNTTAPTITLTNPANLATNVPIDKKVSATFSKPMEPTTIVTTNFTLKEKTSGNAVLGTVSYDSQNNIAEFSPQSNLTPSTTYVALVTTGVRDLAGNALASGLVPNPWEFTTAAPLAVNLRSAASFGIASRAGLTSTGVTVVNGDIALYPTATCTDSTGNAGASQTCLVKTYGSSTGMTVNGSIYWAGDPYDNGGTANSVTNDLQIAWNEGRNKVDTQGAIAGDQMGGKTFIPGVYHNANLGLAAGGIVTIDAQNDPNGVFFFKVDSSFVDSGTLLLPSRINLVNGAQARNVWFVTGLDITIGSGTTWNGNILAGRTATVNNGSTVIGRILAGASGAGAITLTGAASPSVTTITVPQ